MNQNSLESENDSFFDMDEEEYFEEVDNRGRWLTVATVLLSVIVAIFLCILGIRQLSEANQNAGFEDKSWVMTGKLQDLTPDLQTKSNVGIYTGEIPGDDQLNGVTYISNLSDAQEIQSGQKIEFRGSQTGEVHDDFNDEVDALLAKTGDHQVEVVRTGEVGSLKPVTGSLVTKQKTMGWGSLAGAVLVFAGGVFGAVLLNRRRAVEEDYE